MRDSWRYVIETELSRDGGKIYLRFLISSFNSKSAASVTIVEQSDYRDLTDPEIFSYLSSLSLFSLALSNERRIKSHSAKSRKYFKVEHDKTLREVYVGTFVLDISDRFGVLTKTLFKPQFALSRLIAAIVICSVLRCMKYVAFCLEIAKRER